MNKLTTLVASLAIAAMSFASTANSIEYKMGVTGQTSAYFANVEETLKTNAGAGARTTDEEAVAALSYASIFAELAFEEVYGLTVGFEYTPDNIALEKETRVIQNTAGQTAGVGNALDSGTQIIDGSINDLMLAYVAMPIGENGFYVKAGYGTATLQTKENLATGSSYKDEDLEYMAIGAGYDHDIGDIAFVRIEAMYNQFDDIKLTGTQADEVGTTNFNRITGELGGAAAKLSLGLQF